MITALSFTEPFASLILDAGKNPENRKWSTKYRGWFLLHAAKGMTRDDYDAACEFARGAGHAGPIVAYEQVRRGVVLGAARLVGCMAYADQQNAGMDLRWSIPGQYGFFLKDALRLPPVPAQGALSFWKVPGDVRRVLLAECDRARVALPADLRAMIAEVDEAEPPKKQLGLFGE